MRTLIVSDLHLGNGHGHDVLRRPEAQQRLWRALEATDRLVLLGDIVELMGRRPAAAMAVAEPILREAGRRLGADREVIIVPGNHDAPLVRRWVTARGGGLGTAEAVPLDASESLTALAGWLSPARVRAAYPGVWLGAGVWATHGHYLDRHLIPASTVGLLRPETQRDRRLAAPADYESAGRRQRRRRRRQLSDRLRERPLGTLAEGLIGFARRRVVPVLPRVAAGAGLSRLTAATLDVQMRHSAGPALARVVHRLGIDADWVIFGHVHRRGPLALTDRTWARRGEDSTWAQGAGASAGPALVNTGSWLYEPLLLDGVHPPHPYWPGGAVLLGPDAPPRSAGLLDDLAWDRSPAGVPVTGEAPPAGTQVAEPAETLLS